MWPIHTGECCSATERKEALTPATTWMNPEHMMLSERRRHKESDSVWFCLHETPSWPSPRRQRVAQRLSRPGGRAASDRLFLEQRKGSKIVAMDARFREYTESYWTVDFKWLNYEICKLRLDKGAKKSYFNTKARILSNPWAKALFKYFSMSIKNIYPLNFKWWGFPG